MLPGALDQLHPPSDLDVPAARAAAAHYRAAVARRVDEAVAWREACDLFALHHPAWPLPLAEREAARTVGALIVRQRAKAPTSAAAAPLDLLRRLASPAIPRGAAGPVRRVRPLSAGSWPIPPRLPVLRLPAAGGAAAHP